MTRKFLLLSPLAALVAIGCLRPALPEFLRDFWSATLISLALISAPLLFRLRLACRPLHESTLVALFPLALAALYLQPQRVASDGIFYYAPLRSLIIDSDLDFENEYRVLGAELGYFQRTETGRLPNNYSIGPALLWLPSFLFAHALALAGLYRPTGFGYPYFTAVATATATAGFLGVVFLFRLLSAYFEQKTAFLATLLIWVATFHLWYMAFEPSMSHAFAMASVAGFLLLTHRGIRGERSYLLAGAAAGLVALIRWQNVVYLPVALAVIVSRGERPKAREIVLAAAAFLAVFSPQLLYWKLLYGSFVLIPQGGGYIDLGSPRIEEVLLSSRHGLLSWNPVLWLALAGLPSFFRKAPALTAASAIAVLVALYVNASVFDWWGGASFGSRRFDGALPTFGLGLAASIEWLAPRIARHPFVIVSALAAPFAIGNLVLMGLYFKGAIPPDGPASFETAAQDGVDLVYRQTGYPFSWPGALRDLLAHRRPLPIYDLSSSGARFNNVDIRMGETDALFLGRGWSLPRRGRDGTFREAAASGGEIFVSLAEPAPYRLDLLGRPGEKAVVLWNGDGPREVGLDHEGKGSVSIESSRVLPGMNEILLSPPGGKPLGLYRLSLTRPGDDPIDERLHP